MVALSNDEDGSSEILPCWYDTLGPIKPHGLTKKVSGIVDKSFLRSFRIRSFLQTISIKVNGVPYHLISYYNEEDVRANRLQRPMTIPQIAALTLPLDMFRLADFRQPPRIGTTRDGRKFL